MALDRARLNARLAGRTLSGSQTNHPISRARFEDARGSLLGGVPMTWMAKWAGGHPVFAARAGGAWIEDVDGHRYADFALGDTGAMAGHSPAPVVARSRGVWESWAAPRDAAHRGRGVGGRRADAALRHAAAGASR